MTTRSSKLLHACAPLLVLALFIGCSDSEEPSQTAAMTETQKAAPPKVVAKVPKQMIPAKGPRKTLKEQLDTEVDIPEGYPADAPVYPNAKTNTAKIQNGRMTAVFSTPDGPDQVTGFAETYLSGNGWSDVQRAEFPGGGEMLQGYKGRRSLSVLVTTLEAEGETVTLMAVTADPE